MIFFKLWLILFASISCCIYAQEMFDEDKIGGVVNLVVLLTIGMAVSCLFFVWYLDMERKQKMAAFVCVIIFAAAAVVLEKLLLIELFKKMF